MHLSALNNCKDFFRVYGDKIPGAGRVVEIGSQDVNGGIRSCCPARFEYIGVDCIPGPGVDLVLEDPYILPFEAESADIVLSNSCFEHSELFWVLFLEIMRILKPHGMFYLNAPSNGAFHRFPVDCWRFYPDAGAALATWAKRHGGNPAVLESYTSLQSGDIWNDYVAILVKDEREAGRYPERILRERIDLSNGVSYGSPGFANERLMPEEIRRLMYIKKVIDGKVTASAEQKLELIKQVVEGSLRIL